MKKHHLSKILRTCFAAYNKPNHVYSSEINLLTDGWLSDIVVYLDEYGNKYSGALYYHYYIYLSLIGML